MSRATTQYGTAVIPPAAGATAGSLLDTCDPLLKAIAAGFAWALERQLGAAWAAAAAGMCGGRVVGSVHTIDPVPETARVTWQWPALACWRGETRYGLRTLVYDGHETDLHVVYALPPLTQEFLQRLGHVRVAVARTLRLFVEQKGHPEYMSGVNWLEAIGVEAMELVEAEEGSAFEQADLQQKHVGIKMTFTLREREVDTAALAALSTRTATTSQIDLDDGTSEAVTILEVMSGGPLPQAAITLPLADFEAHVGDTLVVSGTCSDARVLELQQSVDESAWQCATRWNVIGATTFAASLPLGSDELGALQLRIVSEGPGGESESAVVAGTVSA